MARRRPCKQCATLRKKLRDALERERLLTQGMDNLIREIRRLKERETGRVRR